MPEASNTATSRTAEIVLDEWAKRCWQRSANSAGITRLIERRYPDFDGRMRALASVTIAVAPLLATPGHATEAEYQEHLQTPDA